MNKPVTTDTMHIAFDQPGAGLSGYGIDEENLAYNFNRLYQHRNEKAGGSKQVWAAVVKNSQRSIARSPNSKAAKEFQTFVKTGKLPATMSRSFLQAATTHFDYGLREVGRSVQHKSNFLDSTFGKILHAIGTVALGAIPIVGPALAVAAGGLNAAARTRPSGLSIGLGALEGYSGGQLGAGIAKGVAAAGGVGNYLSSGFDAVGHAIAHPVQTAAGAIGNAINPPLTSVTYTPGANPGVIGGAVSGGTGAAASAGSGIAAAVKGVGKAANIVQAGAAVGAAALGAGMSKKTNTSSVDSRTISGMTPAEKKTLQLQIDSANNQFAQIQKLGGFTADQFNQYKATLANEVNKYLAPENQITSKSLAFANEQVAAQSGFLTQAQQLIENGGQATPEQTAQIKAAADAALSSGLSDISTFRDESLRSLAQETSQARGLRPSDTPILDVGGRIVNESSRQASKFIDDVRGRQAQQMLDYPLAEGQYRAGLIQNQQTQAANTQNFVQQLRQQAFNNRLNLTSTLGTLGLQSSQASVNPAALQAQLAQQVSNYTGSTSGTTSVRDPLGNISSLFGGAGAALTGLSDSGLNLFGPIH